MILILSPTLYLQIAYLLLGMMANEITKGRLENYYISVGGVTAKIANWFVIFINSAIVLPNIQWGFSAVKMMIIVLGLVHFNYLIGFFGSYFLKVRRKDITAMIINVEMRNASFGCLTHYLNTSLSTTDCSDHFEVLNEI